MAEHLDGTPSFLPYDIVSRFPIGSFLENIAVRSDGTLLVSNMMSGQIFYINPKDENPQSTVQLIHDFNTTSEVLQEEVGGTFSGLHGKAGTWAAYRLDLRQFDSVRGSTTMKTEKLIDIPEAIWLNGAKMIPQTSTLLMADSSQGKLFAFNLHTEKISTWLQDEELGKVTTRPPWPGINGLQYFRGCIFGTVSDRGTLVRIQIDKDGEYKNGSLEIVAKQLTGDDMAFDCEGNAYVATNPAQTVLKFAGMGIESEPRKEERIRILGGLDQKETEGPTALAFGRAADDRDCIYVTTNGGLVNPIGEDGPGEAVIARVCVGVRGEA